MEKSVEEQIKEEEWYLGECKERLQFAEQAQIEIEETYRKKFRLSDEEELSYRYNPLEIEDAKFHLDLCKQRIENLKKFGVALPN